MAHTLTLPALSAPPAPSLPSLAGLQPAPGARAWWWGAVFAGATALALSWLVPTAYAFVPARDVATTASAEAAQRSQVAKGEVQAIRELVADAGTGARRFEMTTRMRDGTVRVSQETGDVRWQVGDRMLWIGPSAAR